MRKKGCLWWLVLTGGITILAWGVLYLCMMGPNLRLAGTHWNMVAFGNRTTHAEVPIAANLSLSFGALPLNIAGEPGDPALSGGGLCNSFSGSYRVTAPSQIRFSAAFIHTGLACMDVSDLDREQMDAFLTVVHETTSFRLENKDLVLQYGDSGGYLRLQPR